MFVRTAIILTFLAQPVLSMAGPMCQPGGTADAAMTSCCCHDMNCPAECPCLESDDTTPGPGNSTPAQLPAPDQLLILLGSSTTATIDADVDHPASMSAERDALHSMTARSFRARIGIWQT